MATVSTKGFDIRTELDLDWLQKSFRCRVPAADDSTGLLDFGYEDEAVSSQAPVRCFIGAVLTAFGTLMHPSESSRQIHPVWMSYVRRLEEEQTAEFFEPVEFKWNEEVYVARRAARRYSQQTHADY